MKLEENNGTYLVVSASCEHEYTVKEVAPTCSSVGYTEYICNKCGYSSKVLSDEKGEHTFEVDEFYGDNDGLTVAEVELASEDEAFVKPEWLGEEVTGDVKYYNSMLMKNPYKNWK
jgi:CYTH domain-containing protein